MSDWGLTSATGWALAYFIGGDSVPDWFPNLYPMMRDAWGWAGVLLFVAIMYAHYGLTILHLSTLAWEKAVTEYRARFRGRSADLTPAPPPPRLTIGYLVAVYNDALTIGPCIESILAQSRRPDQVVVVNDGSTDGTAEVVERYRARGVQVVHLPRNGGKNRALEVGMRLIRTDLVAITDADCVVDRDYVKEILESFRDQDVAAATGVGESIPHNALTAARQVEWSIFYHVAQRAEARRNAIVVLVGNVTTYRSDVLRRIGFDHPTISEDVSATFRLHLMGGKMARNPRARVHVSDPPDLRSFYRQLTRWYTDFWIVVRRYPAVLGKGYFGKVEYPHVALHMTSVSVLHFLLPLALLLVAPAKVLGFLALALLLDSVIVGLVAWLKPRPDLWKALGTRWLTRVVAAWVFLACMGRVLTGTHGMKWKKIERHATDEALAAVRGRLEPEAERAPPPTPPAAAPTVAERHGKP